MINLEEHRGLIFKLMREFSIPYEEREDYYQDFCVHFYTNKNRYNGSSKETTFLRMLFINMLAQKSRRKGWCGRSEVRFVGIDAMPEEGCHYSYSKIADLSKLYARLPKTFKRLLTTSETRVSIAKEKGISRQALQKQMEKDMAKVTRIYKESYL